MEGYRDFFWTPCGQKKHKLSSVQFNLPPGDASEIVAWGASHITDGQLVVNEQAGYARDTRPHISLLYGINATRPDGARRALAGERAFGVRLGRLSAFRHRLFDVLKLEVESDDLHRLNRKLKRLLPHDPSPYQYVPHITLAFMRPGQAARYCGSRPLGSRKVVIDSFVFSSLSGQRTEIRLPR